MTARPSRCSADAVFRRRTTDPCDPAIAAAPANRARRRCARGGQHLGHLLGDVVRTLDQLGPGGLRPHLRVAGPLEVVELFERVPDRGAAGEQPVVAQDHHLVRTEVAHQPVLLGRIERHAFVVVVAHALVEAHRVLRQVQQAALLRRHRESGGGVGVQHAGELRSRAVHAAVDEEPGRVHADAGGVQKDLALQVHLHQARRRHLVEQHAVGIDEEILGARDLGG